MQEAKNGTRKACNFCRKRKIRCDGETPCGACVRHGVNCTVTLAPKRPRPTNEALNQAFAKIQRLESQIAVGKTGRIASSSRTGSPSSPSSSATTATTAGGAQEINSIRRTFSSHLDINNRGDTHYHGPTSALFHDRSDRDSRSGQQIRQDRRARAVTASNGSTEVPNRGRDGPREGEGEGEPAVRTQARITNLSSPVSPPPTQQELAAVLTSNAAREKQSEVMNIVSGKLDFDGWDPELCLHLLSLHWNRQHHAFLVTYRPLFMRDMAVGSSGRYFSPLLLNAILFGAAKFSDRVHQLRSDISDPSSAGMQFLKRVQELLPEALMKSRITTVQALLLLACTHYARGSESAAWLHSGLAFRMAFDLGMNEDGLDLVSEAKLQPEELELRRRVIWAAYVIDKIHSLYQGRQASIKEKELFVPAEFNDSFEELEYWTPLAYNKDSSVSYGCTVHSVSTFTQLCHLAVILERIIDAFYSVQSSNEDVAVLDASHRRLEEQLESWRRSLPACLEIPMQSSPPSSSRFSPNIISLNALHHAIVILLNRPCLPFGHLRRAVDEEDENQTRARSAWKACVDSATKISLLMHHYRHSVTMKGAPQLISYINFCAAGIHVRLAAQLVANDNTTGAAPATAAVKKDQEGALRALKACLDDFQANTDPNPGVAKANDVIQRMAAQLGILERVKSVRLDASTYKQQRIQQLASSPSPANEIAGNVQQTSQLNNARTSDHQSIYTPALGDQQDGQLLNSSLLQQGQVAAADPSSVVAELPSATSATGGFDLETFLARPSLDDLASSGNLFDFLQDSNFPPGLAQQDVMFGFLKDSLGA